MKNIILLGTLFLCGLTQSSPTTVSNSAGKPKSIGVQGAPLRHGQQKIGVEKGPAVIRSSGILQFLRNEGHSVQDYGDLDFGPAVNTTGIETNMKIKNSDAVGQAANQISNATKRILQDGRFPLTFGGDHAIAIGTLNAVSEHYPDLAVIYVDAHADINTVDSTPSGNLHGMPLSLVIKELNPSNANLTQFAWVEPRIPAANVAHIALRDVDPGEVEILTKYQMAAFSMRDIDRFGILGVTNMALDRIGGRERPIYISLDIDSLDDLENGSNTGTPVPGGLTLREVLSMIQEIQKGNNIVGFELAEVNPSLGHDWSVDRTKQVCRQIIACVFGSCVGRWP